MLEKHIKFEWCDLKCFQQKQLTQSNRFYLIEH